MITIFENLTEIHHIDGTLPQYARKDERMFRRLRPRNPSAKLARMPAPFGGMLAISTDIDHTTVSMFRESHRFLNTTEHTPMGEGLGLDISNSLWFFKKDGSASPTVDSQIAYFAGSDWGQPAPWAEECMHYVRNGWVDSLHSYGDFSQAHKTGRPFGRAHAERVVKILRDADLQVPVWVNHGNDSNRQNFGPLGWMEGDDPTSDAYHTDLLVEAGVRYTGVAHTGEDHAADIIRPEPLRDGQTLWGFRRSAYVAGREDTVELGRRYGVPFSTKGGVGHLWVWHPRAIHLQLSMSRLDRLADSGEALVVAQHLGSVGPLNVLGADAIAAFGRLAAYQRDGRILVTRTSRLLDYHRMRDHLEYSVRVTPTGAIIRIESVADPVFGDFIPTVDDLRGLTFEVDDPTSFRFSLGETLIEEAETYRTTGGSGGGTVGIRWWPTDVTDHTLPFVKARAYSVGLWARLLSEPTRFASLGLDTPLNVYAGIGFVNRDRSRLLALDGGDGTWARALAAANEPSQVTLFIGSQTDHPTGTHHGAVLPAGEPPSSWLKTPDNRPVKYAASVAVTSLVDPQALLARLSEVVKARGWLYLRELDLGAALHQLAAACGSRDANQTRERAGEVYRAILLRRGVALSQLTPFGHDLQHHVKIADMSGFRFIDEPRLAIGPDVFGYRHAFDLLFERNANDKKKYFRVPPLEEVLQTQHKTTLWYRQLESLTASGCTRLVVAALETTDVDHGSAAWSRAYVRAGMRDPLCRNERWHEAVERTSSRSLEFIVSAMLLGDGSQLSSVSGQLERLALRDPAATLFLAATGTNAGRILDLLGGPGAPISDMDRLGVACRAVQLSANPVPAVNALRELLAARTVTPEDNHRLKMLSPSARPELNLAYGGDTHAAET